MTEQRYEIIKLLGKGRTGGVYEAEDSTLGRRVALRRFFAQSEEIDLDDFKADFEQVAQSLSILQHPNLLRIYDAGVDGDGAYIISQLLNGMNLQDKIKDGPMPIWEVHDLGQQMLDALSTAHEEGYFHGAITPGSILLTPRARGGYLSVILDMGLSRLAPLIQGKDSILSIMADPAILAPELFGGDAADVKADLYMLGQILYMCLAGGHPFGGISAEEAEKMHNQGLPPIQQYVPDIPEDFRMWLGKLVQIQPYHRPASAVEALNTLPKVLQPAKPHSADTYAATAHLNPESALQLQTPAGHITGPMSNYVGPSSQLNTGAVRLPSAQQGSKKVLLIGLVALAVVCAIVTKVLLSGRDSENGNLKEDVTDAPGNTEISSSEEAEKIIITHFDGSKTNKANGWQYFSEEQQSLAADGWSTTHSNIKSLPGIRFPLRTNENDMFDFGWKLTYVVRPINGRHRLGFQISEKLNPGWGNSSVTLYLSVAYTSDGKVTLSALDVNHQVKSGKSKTVPYNGAQGWHTIVIEQKPEAESGAYFAYIDGSPAFEDTFTTGKSFASWDDHLFNMSFSKREGNSWVVKELKLETP